MLNLNLFEKVSEIKEKFRSFYKQKKKLKSLEHYSEVVPNRYNNYLQLIRRCMQEGFLDDKEADFLEHMIDKLEINYLDWCHKTKWLKKEMARLEKQQMKTQERQLSFLPGLKADVPVHLLNQRQTQNARRL